LRSSTPIHTPQAKGRVERANKTLQTMKPKTTDNHPDLFRSQLSQIINLSHPLCRLADKINWDRLEGEIDQVYGNGNRPYRRVY